MFDKILKPCEAHTIESPLKRVMKKPSMLSSNERGRSRYDLQTSEFDDEEPYQTEGSININLQDASFR
jgi:hypothetical protein